MNKGLRHGHVILGYPFSQFYFYKMEVKVLFKDPLMNLMNCQLLTKII